MTLLLIYLFAWWKTRRDDRRMDALPGGYGQPWTPPEVWQARYTHPTSRGAQP